MFVISWRKGDSTLIRKVVERLQALFEDFKTSFDEKNLKTIQEFF